MWYVSMEKVAGLHFLRSSIFPIQIILISLQKLRNWHNLFFCVPHLKICILANFLMLFSTQVFKVVSHNFCIKVVAWMLAANGLTASSSGVSFSPRGQRNAGFEWLVTKRKGPRKEERRLAKPRTLGRKSLSRERCLGTRQGQQSITTIKLIH